METSDEGKFKNEIAELIILYSSRHTVLIENLTILAYILNFDVGGF